MKTLSVTIITLNEADRLRRCLDSVRDLADEIIILDSGSKDATLDIAREYTDQVFSTDWPGFGVQKQRALEKAGCDWVLAIDADEALDAKLQQWLKGFLGKDRGGVSAVKMPWGVVAYGKLLNHGRSARAPLRMVWREGARFTDAEVHEELVPPAGETITSPGRLLHYSHRDYGHALQKNTDYAWLGAQKYFRKGRRCNSLVVALLKSWWTFFQVYILRLGILDGPVGFLMAMAYAQNNFNKYAGLWTLTRAEKQSRSAI
ncbi:MAG: glycosyltransferase family 2 protein [Gammaproteobacteria bacterium]|nr:glycosyltransferase family 2 protein [Gammaproteobacteria bacterium]NND39680.1 glycosyltransferase family 2 protein [Pseudomonadales bacterium]NNL10155.1 glycosyltransferase family 2 protein [Pseudomonadales bacterium]RZV55305.1 MAG: glycosyltransferase family 2 protein [Pseudomonadales bacterium]